MNTTIARKVTAAIAGVAATAGVFGGIALAAPAYAGAAPAPLGSCTTMNASDSAGLKAPSPLTRASQVGVIAKGANAGGASVTCSRK